MANEQQQENGNHPLSAEQLRGVAAMVARVQEHRSGQGAELTPEEGQELILRFDELHRLVREVLRRSTWEFHGPITVERTAMEAVERVCHGFEDELEDRA